VEIRRAVPDDWPNVRGVRLRALRDTPDAFGSTFEEESGHDESAWRAWATGWDGADAQALFAAVEADAWLGIALGVRWGADAEIANLYAMWVEPGSRRLGAGRELVEAVVGWAHDLPGVRRVHLAATVTNPDAIAFYERCGFADTGERTPLRDGSPLLTVHLERPL
jgi:GNAT superfamily N-acetyltransferase